MPVPFNTHEVIQELQELGFPTAQAEGLTAVLLRTAQTSQEQLATKLDLAEVKAELKTDIAAVRTEMEQRFTALGVQFATMYGEIGRTLDAVKALSDRMDAHIRITYWILGILAAALVSLAWRLLR